VKELSTESRVLMAFLLSIGVMAVWGVFFAPKPQPKPPQPAAVPSGVAQPGQSPSQSPASTPGQPPATSSQRPALQAAPQLAASPKAAAEEKIIVIENDLYRVELSNRGGVVRSWQLKKYVDDHKPPRILDVVHPDTASLLGWPLWITPMDVTDAQTETYINNALYVVTPDASSPRAPGEIAFAWSDGRWAVTKRLTFEHNYVVSIDTSVTLDGKPVAHAITWRGGFGDQTVYNPSENVQVFYRVAGKVESKPVNKLDLLEQNVGAYRHDGGVDYAGIQDRFFAAAFVPRGSGMALWRWRVEPEVERDGKKEKAPVGEMAAGSTLAGPLAFRLFVGPKERTVLSSLKPPMTELVDFGWFSFVAEPLFLFLKWLHTYVPNFGWAIAVMTIAINMVLFPLKLKSWRSMQKMQKVAPEIKTIQEKYKKYSLRDPRKQQMNQEVMEVYKREGVNPMGGCWPMLLQMPIWISLYQMLLVTIELRHASWLWIRDLSAKDPYYVLPVLMAATMYWMQKMTPVTATDPAQQRMMQIMPIMFGGMFIVFPVSSGLVLYILTSNVVGIAQQWFLNHNSPELAKARAKAEKKAEKK
jgi:YidC/Oxa1 family membrane protein insertase